MGNDILRAECHAGLRVDSGRALMGLLGAAATFRLLGHFQNRLAIAPKEGLATIDREIELSLNPPRLYRYVSYFAYITGIFGTAIWGYGDQLLR